MKTLDLQEFTREPTAYAEQIQAGEVFALTYRGKVIAELRRSRSEEPEKAAEYERLLRQADMLRDKLAHWQRANGANQEDALETLQRLREDHDIAGMH